VLLAAVTLIGKHLDVVTNCGGDNAENAAAHKQDGEPKEPRLVEGEKHPYRLSGIGTKATLQGQKPTGKNRSEWSG
jgi:hypothetical protein